MLVKEFSAPSSKKINSSFHIEYGVDLVEGSQVGTFFKFLKHEGHFLAFKKIFLKL